MASLPCGELPSQGYELVEGSSFANTDLGLKDGSNRQGLGSDTGTQSWINGMVPVLRCGRLWKVTTLFDILSKIINGWP